MQRVRRRRRSSSESAGSGPSSRRTRPAVQLGAVATVIWTVCGWMRPRDGAGQPAGIRRGEDDLARSSHHRDSGTVKLPLAPVPDEADACDIHHPGNDGSRSATRAPRPAERPGRDPSPSRSTLTTSPTWYVNVAAGAADRRGGRPIADRIVTVASPRQPRLSRTVSVATRGSVWQLIDMRRRRAPSPSLPSPKSHSKVIGSPSGSFDPRWRTARSGAPATGRIRRTPPPSAGCCRTCTGSGGPRWR